MKVIFQKDVAGSGKRFDVKTVSDGYAINFLFPKSLAVQATAHEIVRLEQIKADEVKKKGEYEAELAKNLKEISEIKLEIKEPANEKGHLFKGLGKDEIIAALKTKSAILLNPSHIILEKPIKEVGEHKITIKVGNTNGFFTLKVTASKAK